MLLPVYERNENATWIKEIETENICFNNAHLLLDHMVGSWYLDKMAVLGQWEETYYVFSIVDSSWSLTKNK